MDDASFKAFLTINENRSRIFAVIVSMVRDFEIAEELLQETVLEILKCQDRFDPNRSFVPWACGIAKNVVLEHWRRQAKLPSSGVCDMVSDLALIASEEDTDLWHRERMALRRCFQQLPERMQNLLLHRYGHNVKGKALAESASFPVGSIRTTLARLRSQLRSCIRSKVHLGTVEANES